MVTRTIDVSTITLEELLAEVRQGREVLLKDGDKMLAKLTPMPARSSKTISRRIPGLHQGLIEMSDDFDDPLPDEFWLGEK